MLMMKLELQLAVLIRLREFVHEGFKAIGGIEDIIGSIDGTHFILRNAPTKDKKFILPGRKDMLCIVRSGRDKLRFLKTLLTSRNANNIIFDQLYTGRNMKNRSPIGHMTDL
ncbi:uncharacterized protein OCT59_006755 [Rhizophagus irregularis]|uniref:uncharacterized protein n=1 Tax=Rhizophagus irregularis TaxID=588596 RepID=UPI0033265FCD|nr:hypothetical protein OCT59_006755 [Rhizophagus irregularis]